MVARLKRYGQMLARVVKRFLADQPANPYETIVFNAVKMAAAQFGGRIKLV